MQNQFKLLTQRLAIEELRRLRRSDDAERFAEVFRHSTVDPNPHQVEAAMFALQRIQMGGAMLCDEVGLGKTIEAGLVISQMRAEGKNHILVIVPLALARQWQVELQDLFSINSTLISSAAVWQQSQRGIHIIGREAAAADKMRAVLLDKGQWDLIVIDEAHEMFSTIHTRFNKRNGKYQMDLSKGTARRAASIKALMQRSPVLLLTATPIQNNLLELWGLVQYVDPDQQVLGKFNEFNSIFVAGEGGRAIVPNMETTLRNRLSLVLKRTLRKQAQPFMKHPFRARHVHTANFNPGALEESLYRVVSNWLGQEKLAAYKRKTHKKLLALQLRRRMASSPEALLSMLENIKMRIETIQRTGSFPTHVDDSDESKILELAEEQGEDEEEVEVDLEALEQDYKTINHLISVAQCVVFNSADVKKTKLLEIIRRLKEYSNDGVASDKVVIFTESKKTLESLFEYLEENGFKNLVTTFSGANEGAVGERALELWMNDVGKHLAVKPDESAMIRGALIHEFKTKTKIFIATEAGAKGLNLQFCNCLINYDLPWNPQRIEQRIGRVHRYGQKHDVVIINFINLSNEAEQRVYQLLEEKLSVFKDVLDASDSIITIPAAALNLEQHVNDMLDSCRTPEQIQEAFDRLNLEIDAQQKALRDSTLKNARVMINELDTSVQRRLGVIEETLGPSLSKCDETLLDILRAEDEVLFEFHRDSRTVFQWKGKRFHIGPPEPSGEFGEPLDRNHPLVASTIDACMAATTNNTLLINGAKEASWEVFKVTINGIEDEEHIAIVGQTRLDTRYSNWGSLDEAIKFYSAQTEKHQEARVNLMLQQISSRRNDLEIYEASMMANFKKKLDAATNLRIKAETPEKMSKAKAQLTKIQGDIEKFRAEFASNRKTALAQLDEEERKIHLGQFVSSTHALLFKVKSSPEIGGTN